MFSLITEKINPHGLAENYMKDKVVKLQGINLALNERKYYIKKYIKKLEIKNIKTQQLN